MTQAGTAWFVWDFFFLEENNWQWRKKIQNMEGNNNHSTICHFGDPEFVLKINVFVQVKCRFLQEEDDKLSKSFVFR